MIKKTLDWLIVSSANPEEYSMTVKGILLQYVAVVIYMMHTLNVPLTQTLAVEYIDMFCTILGGILGIFGICRKIYFAIKK